MRTFWAVMIWLSVVCAAALLAVRVFFDIGDTQIVLGLLLFGVMARVVLLELDIAQVRDDARWAHERLTQLTSGR